MTEVKEEIPCCENCPDTACNYNPPSGWSEKPVDNDMHEMWNHTRQKGCLSHPGARAYLNKNVIAEMEKIKIGEIPYSDESAFNDGIDAAIALLRGDVE